MKPPTPTINEEILKQDWFKQKMAEIKARYPKEINIEGLEPALSHDIAEIVDFALRRQAEGILKGLGNDEEYPPNIKQEIWGGEGGLPSTKIESPDVFGIKYIDGRNSMRRQVRESIEKLMK